MLVCAATEVECACWGAPDPTETLLATGVGIPATLACLWDLPSVPTSVLHVGIAGAYPDTGLAIGDVVVVRTDCFADLGMELPETPHFLPLAKSPFANRTALKYEWIVPDLPDARVVDAGTVSSCTGTIVTGTARRDAHGIQIESMEGAAVAMAVERWQVPSVQVRAISNIAADRSIDREGIRLAFDSLTRWLARYRRFVRETLAHGRGDCP